MASQSNCEPAGPEPQLTAHPGGRAFWAPLPPALLQAVLSLRAASLSGGVCEHLPPRSALSLSPGLATRTAKPVLGLAHAPRGPSEPAPDPTPVLCPAGVPGRRRPPGLLRGPRPRGPAHHPRACVGEPLPREEVLLYHPLTAL